MLFWERSLDFIIIFFLLLGMLSKYNVLGESRSSLITLMIVCSGIIITLFVLMSGEKLIYKILDLLNIRSIRIRQYGEYLFGIFKQYKHSGFIAEQISLSVLYWLIVMLGYYLIFLSAGYSLSLFEALLFLSIGTMGIAIPAGPGSVGIIQALLY